MKRNIVLCTALALSMGCGTSQNARRAVNSERPVAAQQGPFSLAVVPTQSFRQDAPATDFHKENDGEITMAEDRPREFYCVLTNISKEPRPVWEYWNSWGYQNISFEFTTDDGHRVVVSKRRQGFTRNFPSTFTVAPGEHQVYAIRLDKEWETNPILRKADEMHVKVKAVYEVSATPETTQHKVWTGRVESKSYNLTLRQLKSEAVMSEFDKYGETLSPDKLVVRCCTPTLINHGAPKSDSVRIRPKEKWLGPPVVSYAILESGIVTRVALRKSSGVADANEFALNWVRSQKYNSRPGCGTLEGEVGVTIDWR